MTTATPDHDQRQHVIQACYDHDVKFIRLWFTDILGVLKSMAITIEELEHALDDGVTFDGASIEGFARVDEADMVAVPDPSTFQLLPWRPSERAVARMLCDVRVPGGEPFEGDPRWVLKRTLARAAEQGLTFYVSPEIEFFYFRDASGTEPLDRGGYFDLTPLDSGSDLRRETVLTLEEMGIGVALSHHEAAPSQHEIDLRYMDALTMADAIMTYRLVVKEVAMRHGVYATFMPKPQSGVNGSGMHLQLSLFRGEENAFAVREGAAGADDRGGDALGLTPLARSFMAGLLAHAGEAMLVTNQWVNSYRRLVPGFEAPTHATWSTSNHADLLRVPRHKPGDAVAARIEYRVPDPACNPYLAFAALLAAGLDGLERESVLPEPLDRDVRELDADALAARAITPLPASLGEAITAFAGSELLRETLGTHVFESLVANKRHEWDEYRSQVSAFELDRYLGVL
ncbi:MAG: glutamine synthetase family protein [Chloroflexi bacterium]|nr:glutamine synthetase family protein [Chloroflexota bacterium]